MKKSQATAPLPVKLLIVSFLFPTELSLFLAGLRLPPHRVALLILLPLALLKFASGRGLKLKSYDVLMLLFALWTTFIYNFHHGWEGFVYGGSMALECFGGYLIARAFVRDEASYRGAVRFMFLAVMIAAAIALLDTVSGQYFTHSMLRQFFGGEPLPPMQFRGGLARAASVFDHPIHYGTFCAVMLACYWSLDRSTGRSALRAGAIGFATLLGMSSAPLLSLALQSAMLVWERATRTIKKRTVMTLIAIAGIFIGVSLGSNRGPIQIIATSFTLDAWTGYYRTQIWTFGLDNVWMKPIIGIGLGDWARPEWMVSSTVDAYWLVVAMRSGIPGFLLMALPIYLLGRGVVKHSIAVKDASRRILARGWMISLVALCLVSTTVHLWNVVQCYFFFFIGLGAWMSDVLRSKAKKPAVAAKAALQASAPPPYLPPEPYPSFGYGGAPQPAYG